MKLLKYWKTQMSLWGVGRCLEEQLLFLGSTGSYIWYVLQMHVRLHGIIIYAWPKRLLPSRKIRLQGFSETFKWQLGRKTVLWENNGWWQKQTQKQMQELMLQLFSHSFVPLEKWSGMNKAIDMDLQSFLWNVRATIPLLSLLTEETKHMNNIRCHM